MHSRAQPCSWSAQGQLNTPQQHALAAVHYLQVDIAHGGLTDFDGTLRSGQHASVLPVHAANTGKVSMLLCCQYTVPTALRLQLQPLPPSTQHSDL
jgi:hypothetical protein